MCVRPSHQLHSLPRISIGNLYNMPIWMKLVCPCYLKQMRVRRRAARDVLDVSDKATGGAPRW